MTPTEPQYGLKPEVVQRIQNAFVPFAEIDSVILYGSRAKGNYRNGSDIDLSIKTNPNLPERDRLLFEVMGAIDDLDLVYSFDISLFGHIKNDDLIDHINRVGVVFYQREHFLQQQQARKQEA